MENCEEDCCCVCGLDNEQNKNYILDFNYTNTCISCNKKSEVDLLCDKIYSNFEKILNSEPIDQKFIEEIPKEFEKYNLDLLKPPKKVIKLSAILVNGIGKDKLLEELTKYFGEKIEIIKDPKFCITRRYLAILPEFVKRSKIERFLESFTYCDGIHVSYKNLNSTILYKIRDKAAKYIMTTRDKICIKIISDDKIIIKWISDFIPDKNTTEKLAEKVKILTA